MLYTKSYKDDKILNFVSIYGSRHMLSMASDRVNGENDFNISTNQLCNVGSSSLENHTEGDDVQVSCFTEDLSDVTFHFQIIRLKKQVIHLNT